MQTEPKELFTPAPLGKRFLAFVVDGLIGGLVLLILSGVFMIYYVSAMLFRGWPFAEALVENVTETIFYLLLLGIFLSFIWFVYYGLLRDSFKNGQSWGKRLLGLKVVELEGKRACSRGASLTRNFPGLSLLIIAFFLPFVGWALLLVEPVAVLASPEGQRMGDRWGRTQVVKNTAQDSEVRQPCRPLQRRHQQINENATAS